MGKSPYRAALEAADEIGLAVIAISLTIIAIFAPASFMSGIAGQFFKQFGITVSVQVFFSLLAARFVTPVLAAYFLKDIQHEDPPPGRILSAYTNLVTWSVKHYFITVLIGFGIFAASIWSITLLPQGFLPAQDTARSLLAMELPPGSQLAYTEKVTEEIVARLRKRPEIKSVFVDGGRVPPGTLEVRRAALIINYTPKTERRSAHPARARTAISARNSKTSPTSVSGSSTKTACARSRWSSPASTATSSATSPASWRRR